MVLCVENDLVKFKNRTYISNASYFSFVLCLNNTIPFGEHLIETSSLCPQLCMPHPPCLQCPMSYSVPEQTTSSNRIGPVP